MKISAYVLVTLIGLLLLTGVLVNIPFVQNWLVTRVTHRLSKDLHTTVRVKHINFNLAMFNKMSLEGTLVQDHQHDTLLYAGKLKVNITDWFFLKDTIVLKYIGLQDATINLHRADSVWNYQFLADYFSGPPSTKKKQAIDLDLKRIELSNIHFLNKDEWRGEDLLFHVRSMAVDAKRVNLAGKNIDINSITLDEPLFSIYDYAGKRPALPPQENTDDPPPVRDVALNEDSDFWQMALKKLTIRDGIFKVTGQTDRKPYYYFDGVNMVYSRLNSTFTNVKLFRDTITARIVISTHERSGLEVKSLTADFRMHPQAMEFANLDIQTNKSHLHNFFAMRYHKFSDMDDFTTKVRMEGHFSNSEIESDDIAFFAPDVATWKKRIFLTGIIKGTVSDLSAKGITIKAGQNTVLKGDLKIVGLPDVEKMLINLKANEFKTTYADAVAFVPKLKKIQDPRIDRLRYLYFDGFFTGFLNDFITSGNIRSNLGSLYADVNMRFPARGATSYSGNVRTSGFNVGSLLDNDQLGQIAFDGKIKGNGFNFKALQAELDGNINSLDFRNYKYRDIRVKGTFAKKLFNGEFAANDSNLVANLNGLIDFSKEAPTFDFTAYVDKLNLKNLHLYSEDIDFNGKMVFNFTGSNIDNFLGTAKISNASIFRDGQRLSFDSLSVISTRIDSSKSIAITSNEFNINLKGEFSIKELPNAFQKFLYRYYPSYINPPRQSTNENFTFSIRTGKVDDYLSLVDRNLKGFNSANVSGLINSKENLFALDAEVPQFEYKNISFYKVDLNGRGNHDSLLLNAKVGDVHVNDSLHFPGTEISIKASQDLSKVNILTSANQTLNSANIAGQVETLKDGIRVVFNKSSFDINGKTWMIDKDGGLTLSKKLVTTTGLRIYSSEQEAYITSVPSLSGETNNLRVALKKINIGDFTPFFTKDNRLEGLLNGTVEISDPFGDLQVNVKAEAQQFRLDDDSLGRLQISSDYLKSAGRVNASIISENENYNFDLVSFFNISDSSRQGIDLKFNLRNTNIHLIQKYLSDVFSRVSGQASGTLEIAGASSSLKYLGDIKLTNAGMMVNYTKCYYKIPSAEFKLNDGSINFGTFTIRDTLNNEGEIVNGRLDHQSFSDLAFDFHLRSNRLLLLNTTAADNNQFYGTMIGKVNMSFTGPLEDMQMDIKGEPTDSSKIYLPIGSSRESGEAGFIVWKVYGREMKEEDLASKESNFTVSLDITANPLANVYVILDALTGDIIEANGNGNIKLRVGSKEPMTMSGRYNIEGGNYTFTFQSLKRNFKLREEAGSYISWNGDPFNATINIEAEYDAENVRFSDLLNNTSLAGAANEDVKKYRGRVMVIADLTERLTAPKIAFRIELPQNSPIRSSQDVATIFSFIQNDVNELNKQVSFLILFNTFGPYTGGGSRGGGTSDLANKALEGIVVNSISGFLSSILTREFSNILQDIFKDKSLKVNISASLYSGTNLIDNYNPNQVYLPDRTNFNLSIGKSFFNERLTFIVGGALDFGLNTTQQSQSSAFPFLPDVTAEFRLSPDGKFRLTFFYRENYSYMGTAGGKQNRSGSSISFRKEFDRIDELFRKTKKKAN